MTPSSDGPQQAGPPRPPDPVVPPGGPTPGGPTPRAEAADAGSAETGSAPSEGFWARWRRRLRRLVPVPKTPLGVLALVGGVLVIGAIGTLGGVEVVHYSEGASFCTTCHTMEPQKKAYEAGVHQDVACGECHVEPGVLGFVKAKLAGTRELYALVTNTYPTPIPAIEHDALPTTEQTCEKCHPLSQIAKDGQPTKLITRASFSRDEKNTRNDLAVLIRPAQAGTADEVSMHWHVLQEVTYTSTEEHQQTIDSVEFRDSKTGELVQYIAEGAVRQSANADADIARLKATGSTRTMDCLACHNRVGHDIPSVDKAVDQAMASGAISPTLPYIKRNAITLLNRTYATDEDGEAAIGNLAELYSADYPAVAKDKAKEIAAASKAIAGIYELVVTSEMNTRGGTYADNLGHQSSPGCFRCHDGAHYKVVEGQVTKETIPSTCNTCHTFPQGVSTPASVPIGKGSTEPVSVPIGKEPADHADPLFVFSHRNVAGAVKPAASSCGACHEASYCQDCHDSGAVKVDHYGMLYNHAQSVLDAGSKNACAVCHQPAYCSQCHKDPVLVQSNAKLSKGSG
ncbi:cytochrome c3 family protein [Intrasporangium calvum]|uniref:NapC/NirT cytochrome c domain protein n=1 Tax=Intrasporangium calvum (strain ATCC 23552 / DSM 43043 / JCM 3097 / NBRC 12989 / NCIMB 10167 / NRRL B-3866 / 7 KIP) TaxID=710696 RepID=E6SB94_INTC7|nr:NapC/NirT family cytochrome c [Intrasporangium calvum]ADU48382.1 NapC/NirT cytochrome c domain protein [Intrasporangium calvum DSM 43043]